MSMLPEILFDIPGTAPGIGGYVIADSPEGGVVDDHPRVFGYRNMHVCDRSIVASNLEVNASLTITALAERPRSFIQSAVQSDRKPMARSIIRLCRPELLRCGLPSPGATQDAPNLFRRNGKTSRDTRDLAPLALPDLGDD
jgi:hypothetical protein